VCKTKPNNITKNMQILERERTTRGEKRERGGAGGGGGERERARQRAKILHMQRGEHVYTNVSIE